LRIRQGEALVPDDNPFVARSDYRPEIWALGMRNPWRFSFDRETGILWAGDVGQGSQEEIDQVVRGGNYGWKIFEGNVDYENPENRRPTDYQRPIWTYGRADGSSVIGGYVYRGARLPELRGTYLFGDFGSNAVWTLKTRDGSAPLVESLGAVEGLVSFAEGQSGELYAVSLYGKLFELR
jgi:glucose/arabinose dehydrogenase